MKFTSSGKLPTLMIGNVYPLRQLQENWFFPLPRNVCAENSQAVQLEWEAALELCRSVFDNRTVNSLC